MRLRAVALLGVAVGLVVALATACGAPSSGGFTVIEDNNIPDVLTETTTTMPTTTTTTTTIELASTTAPTEQPSTTIVATEPVTLYFIAGSQLVPVSQLLARPVTIAQTMKVLEQGPVGAGVGLRTALSLGLESRPSNAMRGVVKVDLDPAFFAKMDLRDQRLAIGQIVLTLTEQRGVGAVMFTQNGQPIEVFLDNGATSTVGQNLAHDDYVSLLNSPPPTTSTTTTTTTTTVPSPPPGEAQTTVGA